MGRALRADAERSVRAILEAAERVLAEDPGASMEQIAEAAGLARTTVHRRFANRQVLIEALAASAKRQLTDAIEDAHLDTAPPLVALHRAIANTLRIKSAWRFTLGNPLAETGLATDIWTELNARSLEFLRRAQREGLLDPAADLEWTRRVYYALIGEVLHGPGADQDPDAQDPDALATRIVDTLLHGAGPRG
ncbi:MULTISPECIES: TetR/AcrR family transcriptional regulator [unclassified Streptomyces]|uniref:TetR/AcrR family transcriptional regulator n=1 Tax=unclassified Streptomyces TaxID=2593676 RepID=UPI002259CD92|nr:MULTISPECIES: TetR/AcrR family transcriptional regulator [unclassified Streptomyces]MCX5336011.1 TetR/AcrR family transcriptional regulator [Streptomyces sp. NBC_00140]MCX5366731.1 TetR/AcrR family transcriptional regulator [Streptomyces sp. NBC_00124]